MFRPILVLKVISRPEISFPTLSEMILGSGCGLQSCFKDLKLTACKLKLTATVPTMIATTLIDFFLDFDAVGLTLSSVTAMMQGSADQLTVEQTINREMMTNEQQQSLTTATAIPC